jgi:hypothetical protein
MEKFRTNSRILLPVKKARLKLGRGGGTLVSKYQSALRQTVNTDKQIL